jgi:poly(beta-D-mannuronate) lyase
VKSIRCNIPLALTAVVLGLFPQQVVANDGQNGTPVAESCQALKRDFASVPCEFDFSGFVDGTDRLARVDKLLEAGGILGKRYRASNADDLNALSDRLKPGDEVVLADGTWHNSSINLHETGSLAAPILVAAQTPGKVIFDGSSSIQIWGSNIALVGVIFRDGFPDKATFTVVQLGAGLQKPCDGCIVDRIAIDNYNSPISDRETGKVFYLNLQGRDIVVAKSRFTNQENVGTMVHADAPAHDECPPTLVAQHLCYQRLLVIDNVLSGFSQGTRVRSKLGKDKLLEIGSGQAATEPAYTVIEGNMFTHADGGINTVSIKESDVIIRGNSFQDNLGTLNLRSANRVLVQDNVFDGTARAGMGGVLVQGQGHWIIHNVFRNLRDPGNDYTQPLAISAGTHADLVDGQKDYAQARDIVIANNVFEHSGAQPIVLGIMARPGLGRTLPPLDIYILNNAFDKDAIATPVRKIEGENIVVRNSRLSK